MDAGGAATTIQVQCDLDGSREISIFNKKDNFYERAEKTVQDIKREVLQCIANIYDLDNSEKLYEEISTSDILANATIVGMKPYEN